MVEGLCRDFPLKGLKISCLAIVDKLARDFSKLVDFLRLPGLYLLDQVTKLTVARV